MGKDEPSREDMTDNTIWVRTMEDSTGSNKSTSKEVIRSFYEYIDNNKETITPYIQKDIQKRNRSSSSSVYSRKASICKT